MADQWIPMRPTTDVSMMIAMANVWFKENLCDREFINRNVEPEGLRKWQDYVLGLEDGVDKTPAWAETICGVPRLFKNLLVYTLKASRLIECGGSIGRQFYGENPSRAVMYLQALTGNACVPGGTCGAETSLHVGHPSLPTPAVDWKQRLAIYNTPRTDMYLQMAESY